MRFALALKLRMPLEKIRFEAIVPSDVVLNPLSIRIGLLSSDIRLEVRHLRVLHTCNRLRHRRRRYDLWHSLLLIDGLFLRLFFS